MECDYTRLNHNLLVSHKKLVTNGLIIKGVGFTISSFSLENNIHNFHNFSYNLQNSRFAITINFEHMNILFASYVSL
jgi:hypothetical protein